MDQLKNMEEKSLGRASCQSCKYWTIFIFLSILFSVSFHLSSLFYLELGWSVISHVTWYCHIMSQSQSQDHVIQRKL